jgi:molecular chaperone DnaK (HSP70)
MMAKVVKRNSTIPVLQEKEFTTAADNQSMVGGWRLSFCACTVRG